MQMTGTAFIKMMREDIETHKDKEVLKPVVDCMECVIGLFPNCEIDSTKTAEGLWQKMQEYAKDHQKNGLQVVTITPNDIGLITEYLGLKDAPAAPQGAGRVKLEDFFDCEE